MEAPTAEYVIVLEERVAFQSRRIERLRTVAREAHAWLESGADEQAEKRALDRLSWAVDALESGDLDDA